MPTQSESITVVKLAEILFAQCKAGNGHHSVACTLEGANYAIASVANDPDQLSLVFQVENRDKPDVDLFGSKRIRWLFPRIGTNNQGMDVLKIDVSRTLAVPPILIGYDGNRRGWSILTMLKDGETYIAQESAFVPSEQPVNMIEQEFKS